MAKSSFIDYPLSILRNYLSLPARRPNIEKINYLVKTHITANKLCLYFRIMHVDVTRFSIRVLGIIKFILNVVYDYFENLCCLMFY